MNKIDEKLFEATMKNNLNGVNEAFQAKINSKRYALIINKLTGFYTNDISFAMV